MKKNELQLQKIQPEGDFWDLFLNVSIDYFLEVWPESFKGKSLSSLMHEYDQQLRKRIKEGNRFLFLFKRKKETLGFANVYLIPSWIPNTNRIELTLHIAEFSILPIWRRQKFGAYFFQMLIDFGKNKDVGMVMAEVDLKNKEALKFWREFFPDFLKTCSRICFWKVL